MLSWVITGMGLIATWYYIDLESQSGFRSLGAPLLFGFLLIVIAIKIASLVGPAKVIGSGDIGGISGDGGCGGDGGGC